MTVTDALTDFDQRQFTFDGKQRRVFTAGSGPAVVVMAEMPGITPAVARFARKVVELGCTVWMPDLFGVAGQPPGAMAYARSLGPACVARDFAAFAAGTTAPVVGWLRALAAEAHSECGGPGVGAVGMCFTGGFALGMMVDDRMLAPVLSQPSLPIVVPWRRGNAGDVGLSDADRQRVAERVAQGACVLGLRFSADALVPSQRFDALHELLGDGFIAVDIDSSPGNAHGIGRRAHSVLTEELVDDPDHPTQQALVQVLTFLRQRLLDDQPADGGEPSNGDAPPR